MSDRSPAIETGQLTPGSDVQLLMADERNRELLAEWLSEVYDVTAPTTEAERRSEFDLCIVDEPSFARYRDWLATSKEAARPSFLPVVLVSDDQPGEQFTPDAWDDLDGLSVIDEIVSVPVDKSILYRRLENLLERRVLSRQLAGQAERTEERFRALLDGTPDPVFVLSAEHELLYVNDALCSLVDIPCPQLLGSQLVDVQSFSASTAAAIGEHADRCIEGRTTDTEVVSFETSDGTQRFAEINVDSIDCDDHDEVVVIMRDVTARREREQELYESERRFRAMFENSLDGLLIANDDAEYMDANPAACELTGLNRDQLLELSVSDLAAGSFDVESVWETFLEDGTLRGEFSLERPDGDERFVEFNAVANIRPGRHLSALRDITERKEMEQQLRQSEQQFRQMATNVQEIIWMTDETGEDLLYVGPGVEELTGVPVADIEADPMTVFDVVHPDDEEVVRTVMMELFVGDDPDASVSMDFRIRRPDGTVRWVELSASAVATDEGRIHRYVGMVDDITDLKERQQALQAKNKRLDQFASLVSHDLRNPLQAAMSRVEIGQERDDVDQFDAIGQNLDRMNRLIDDMLKLAREGDPVTDPEPVALAAVARREWQNFDTADASLDVESDATVRADPDRLGQLFANLFRNALEHAGDDPTVRVGLLPNDTGFFVEDDGPGIPESEREDVFEMGYSTSDDGTGFGLSIVKEIAEAHDWLAVVTEGESDGARFVFTNVGFRDDA